ncbi:hypothetical protein [Streptomyces sp. NPDC021224]|uniref:hypothetical protein n=1 Tax=unclassified Streptomyces TaxID=2593676 RepID=UPI0037983CB6
MVAVAEPPRLLRTVIGPGLSSHWCWASYVPPPLAASGNMKLSEAVRWTPRIAFGSLLVAVILSRPFFHSALLTVTLSVTGGADAGTTVTVPDALPPSAVAVTVTSRSPVTAEVETGKGVVSEPTVASTDSGTLSTAGSLLTRWISPVSGSAAPDSRTFPVARPPAGHGVRCDLWASARTPVGPGRRVRREGEAPAPSATSAATATPNRRTRPPESPAAGIART